MKWILSLLMLGTGVLLVWKTSPIVNSVGRFAWAERHLGATGTYTFYKLVGVVLIVIAMLTVTGIGEGILESLVGGFVGNVSEPAEG